MKNINNVFTKYSRNLLNKVVLILILGFLSVLPDTISAKSAGQSSVTTNILVDYNLPNPAILAGKRIDIVVGESRFEDQVKSDNQQKELDLAKSAQYREVYSRESIARTSGPSINEKRGLVKDIASRNGIDWKILEAVWEVESGKSWDRSVTSYAGAQGPMQFLPSTFRHYAPPGANINSARDSLEAGAKLLALAGGANGDIDQALFSYNHSGAYVSKVKRVASSINE